MPPTAVVPYSACMPFVLTRSAARCIDADAQRHHGLSGLELMERAARGAVEVACTMVQPEDRILVACGCGSNGGDGWAMARLLHHLGYAVDIVSLGSPPTGSDAAANAERAGDLALNHRVFEHALPDADLIIDAVFGTGLNRMLTGTALHFIRAINAHPAPVLAIDVPSGLDVDSGEPHGDAVQADATATCIGPKAGFAAPDAQLRIGAVHIIDLGVPEELIRRHAEEID